MKPKEYALELAAGGAKVFPLAPRSKIPYAGSRGVLDATSNPGDCWPDDCNYGIATGGGLCVVDVDVKPGHPGKESLAKLPGLPPTYTVRTPSGGWHMYYRCPAVLRSKNAALPGIDFRADGYYVVGPGSVLDNGEYTVVNDQEIAEIPSEIIKILLGEPAGESIAGVVRRNEPGWVETLSQGSGPGTHDDSMTKLAGYYISRKLSVAQVIDIIRDGYGKRAWAIGSDGRRVYDVIKIKDIQRVVNSVSKAELGKRKVSESEFVMLGRDHDKFYYLPRKFAQIVELRANEHNKSNLLLLAPRWYWDNNFSTGQGVSWDLAQAMLIEAQTEVGLYDPERIRGTGAWIEDGEPVWHAGDKLITKDGTKDLSSAKYVYERGRVLDVAIGKRMGVEQAARIAGLFSGLSWEHGDNEARLALGWCVCAVVCGALSWRPHIWITGPSGSGKSYVMDAIIRRMVGGIALVALSETTEPGLRQALRNDARPVIFDEAEAENQRGQDRMQNVLGLMRQASTETGGSIIKGSAEGIAKSFRIRSCFAMSSINVSAYQTADKNRITVLNMKIDDSLTQDERDVKFAIIQRDVINLLTDEAMADFRMRCISMIPTIRENANVLGVVAAAILGSRRLGDQLGALLAGACAMLSDDVVTPEQAEALIRAQDLSEQQELQETNNDEMACLEHLLQHVTRVRCGFGSVERSVASLYEIACGASSDVTRQDAEEALGLIGLRVVSTSAATGLAVASRHSGLEKVFQGKPWLNWAKILMRLPSSKRSTVRIGGRVTRAVVVKVDVE